MKSLLIVLGAIFALGAGMGHTDVSITPTTCPPGTSSGLSCGHVSSHGTGLFVDQPDCGQMSMMPRPQC